MSKLTLNVDRARIPQKIEEDKHWWFASRTRALMTILNKYNKRRDLMILDVGCGTGLCGELLYLHAEELIKQRDIVVKALVAKDLEESVASFNSVKFGEEISKAAALYNEKKNLQIFDTYFDKILYQYLAGSMKNYSDKEATKLVAMDIDFYNILSIIRGKFWELQEDQIEDLIINTGPTSKELFGRMMAASTLRDAFNELSNTKYKNLIPQAENDLDAIAEFERGFEMMIYDASRKSFTKMFSFANIVGITKLTSFEVRNLAAIAFAIEQKIPTETTMSKLILEEE